MSHADDGTLHAYLDGELTPVERERVEGHLAGCPTCRDRLGEARALIERAARLLDLAVPSSSQVAPPPLQALRRRPAWWRARVPLTWAATVVLAVGLGWYLRGRTARVPEEVRAPVVVVLTPDSTRPVPAAALATTVASESAHPSPAARRPHAAPLALGASQEAARDRLDQPSAAAKAAPPTVRARGQIAQPPRSLVAVAPGAAAEESAAGTVNGVLPTSTWTVIDSETARGLLGTEPVLIPDRPVRSLRQGPASEVLVEQEVGNGVVVTLLERTSDNIAARGTPRREVAGNDTTSAAPAAALLPRRVGPLTRFVGPLFVEIGGPLPADSLSRLLQLVR